MRPNLNGNILFVFSDPGGAKPVLSLIEENNLTHCTAVSDRVHPFYTNFATPVKIVTAEFEKCVDEINPSLIFTGTSYKSDIEKKFIAIARKKNIPCYSFVDHWTAIINRFTNDDNEIVLPDQVWVIDERARQLAMEQGIDENRLVITGNPYHDWMKNWKPLTSKEQFMKSAGISNTAGKILLFAPDPLSNVNGMDMYGFDEISATREIASVFHDHLQSLEEWKVLIKTHPNQNRSRISESIPGTDFSILPESTDTNTCLYYSDVVVGFFSSILLEARILNKPVLRYLPVEVKDDPISALRIGSIVNKNSLAAALINPSAWN